MVFFFAIPRMTTSNRYDPVGNVTQVTSSYPWLQNQNFSETFTYDASDQLISASETNSGSYQLTVSYGNWGKITCYSLAQADLQNNTTQSEIQSYTYPAANSLQNSQTLFAPAQRTITDANNNVATETLTFGINGSLRRRDVQAQNSFTEYYLFNSAANLKAYSNNGLDFAYYGYNASNTRTYKISMLNANTWVNGQPEPLSLQLQQAMFYPNAYLNFNHNGEYTKHYYNGSERIASRLGDAQPESFVISSNDRLGFRTMQADQQARAELLEVVEAGDVPIETPSVDVTTLQVSGNPDDIFYYHTNHLGSTAFITDNNTNIHQGFLYAPFGEITTEYDINFGYNVLPKYSFNAKELDEETGMYYYEARYYKPPVFTSRDPMFEKYFWMTPYAYCANNPVKYVDPSGEDISTHVDKDGNVIASYDDGNLGVFMHSDEEINDYNINGTRLENDFEKMVGVTLYEKSFEKGDKIDLESNQAEQWLNAFEGFFAHAWTNQIASILLYAMNAGNGDLFDPKSKFSHGSQISKGVYVSPRDLGNFAAGFFGRLSGLSKERTLASFGAFQLAGNNKKEFFNSYSKYYRQALGTMGEGLVPFQKTYGEKGISNYFQRLGYENIRTLEDFNNRYSDIWK